MLDDFEDENNTVTPESRAKISNLVTAVVFPALEPGTGRLRINGTPVHFDSFIQNILVSHDQAKKKGEDLVGKLSHIKQYKMTERLYGLHGLVTRKWRGRKNSM